MTALLFKNLRRMDWTMLLAVLALLVTSILFIYSASFRSVHLPVSSFYQKQIGWALVGLGCYLGMISTDYYRLRDAAWWFYGVSLVLLMLVLIPGIGKRVYGAYRWLSLFGVQFQPSELAKLSTIIVLARFMSRPGRDLADVHNVFRVALIVLPPVLLIVAEPDLSTASVLLLTAIIMLYIAGLPMRALGVTTLLGLLVVGLLLGLLFWAPAWFPLSDYQKERILVFLDPGRDPLNHGWNAVQSALAVGSGGLTGKGFLKGTQDVLGYLPRTVAPTDFIYSVIAEEVGFVGSVVLLSLYAVILSAGLRAAAAARDKLGRLLAAGMTGMLFCHVFINIAMTIGLLPIMGIPLPLISYGGTFMVSTMAALGLAQSVYVRRYS
ncbi:MAG: rod shape-determining protein RodA [Kiritimatiellaeota bacterium]|nr:rod shape-determining protein RodA [Kiritimatiellota bacterium]